MWNHLVEADEDGVRADVVVDETGGLARLQEHRRIRADIIRGWLSARLCGRVKQFGNGVW